MAKKETTANADEKLIMDVWPGADPISEEDAKPFEVDLNFDTPDDEVEFPKEDEIEEISETELTTTPEEMEEKAGEQEETTTDPDEEVGEEETVVAEGEVDTQESIPTDERNVVEPQVGTKEPMIPKSRFDEVLAKQKALQKKLEEATAPAIEAITEAPEYDFDAKEIQYQDHILNGEPEKATALRADMRKAEREQMIFEMQNRMGQTVQKNQEALELEAKAQQIALTHPQLDETSATYDQNLTQEVLELRDAFIVQGFTGADALDRAAKYVVGSTNPISTPKTENNVTETKRKVANVQKKLDAAESQPPAMKGQNKTEKKIDLNVLSTEEFDALPAETLRRMRGDFG